MHLWPFPNPLCVGKQSVLLQSDLPTLPSYHSHPPMWEYLQKCVSEAAENFKCYYVQFIQYLIFELDQYIWVAKKDLRTRRSTYIYTLLHCIECSPTLGWHPCVTPPCLKGVLHGDRVSPGEWSKPKPFRQPRSHKSQAATRKQGTKECGADVSPVSLDMSWSALQEAIERGYTGITTMLMKAMAEVSHLRVGCEFSQDHKQRGEGGGED